MENTNLPQVNINADLTDVIKEGYEDTVQKPLQSSSGVVTTVIDFFHNTVLYPMQKYNLYAKSKLENFAKELQENVEKIPTENLIEPKVNILGPVMEGLKYNLDEEHIKEMFQNILLADMDNRTQNKVHPSFINIVKELSQKDALSLKRIKDHHIIDDPIIRFKYVSKNGGFLLVNNNIYIISKGSIDEINSLVINNLKRLNLIEVDFLTYKTTETLYENVFNAMKSAIPPINLSDLSDVSYDKGVIKLTDMGKNFIDICLS